MSENKVDFYPGANWVSISGNFTPEELRDIANQIDEAYKDVEDGNKK